MNYLQIRESYLNPIGNALFIISLVAIGILVIYFICEKVKENHSKSKP